MQFSNENFSTPVSVDQHPQANYSVRTVTLVRSLNDKVKKIVEEAGEVSTELNPDGTIDPLRVDPLVKEIIDTMVSCQSALNHFASLGVNVQQKLNEVYQKNYDRGYYTPGGIPYVRDQQPSG